MKKQYDLGIYDSGIGGLTIAYALLHKYSSLRILYYADTAYLPLGDKSPELIKERALEAIKYFKDNNCRSILYACNTVSTICYDDFAELEENIPIFNVVDTLIESLKEHSYENALLFSTSASYKSGIFERKLKDLQFKKTQVLDAPKLVPYIEKRNTYKGDKIKRYLLQLKNEASIKPDAIIFGCTHFPIIRHAFKEVFGHKVKFHDAIIPTMKVIEKHLAVNDKGKEASKMLIHCTQGDAESLIEHYIKIDAYESAYT